MARCGRKRCINCGKCGKRAKRGKVLWSGPGRKGGAFVPRIFMTRGQKRYYGRD